MNLSTVSRIISTEDITTFWKRFREIFSPQQEKLWDGLLTGLQRYHRVLEGMTRNIFLLQEPKSNIYKYMCFKLVVMGII
jgi:3-hydroxy-3-methylglutaryl CoA synthase